jgi:hypothetical protein
MKRSDIMDNSTKNDILLHLQEYGSITGAVAYDKYRCYRLAVVISRLRERHIIETIMCDGETLTLSLFDGDALTSFMAEQGYDSFVYYSVG